LFTVRNHIARRVLVFAQFDEELLLGIVMFESVEVFARRSIEASALFLDICKYSLQSYWLC